MVTVTFCGWQGALARIDGIADIADPLARAGFALFLFRLGFIFRAFEPKLCPRATQKPTMTQPFIVPFGSWRWLTALSLLANVVTLSAAVPLGVTSRWSLPDAREVQLRGPLGQAYARGVARLAEDPYRSASYLRSDISFETNRIFVNYSGDISGRFIQIASLISPKGQMVPSALPEVLQDISKWQKPDGHFGRDVNWSEALEPENSNAKLLPIFWGNSRLLVGLVEAYRAFNRPELLEAARKLGDFYIASNDRFLDPAREPEYRFTGTYAAGYITDYFPGIEGLALLHRITKDARYLQQAERMAGFFQRFDTLPLDHSHGNLVTQYGLLLLYEATDKREYLERPLRRWEEAVSGGYVWPLGGVGEKFRVSFERDEGCSEADWLRLNLRLWELTGETRFLDMAERLLCNHYNMNRTANGGYGHHEFTCDATGPLLMKPEFTEAVWCCTFHGLLGLHTFKSHVLAGSPQGLFINFPVEASATVHASGAGWKVSVERQKSAANELQDGIRIAAAEGTPKWPEVFVRRPAWATEVVLLDKAGKRLEVRDDQGNLKLTLPKETQGEFSVRFVTSIRIEDRRLHPLDLDPKTINRLSGVTLLFGPHVLLADTSSPRPVLIAAMSPAGRLALPPGKGGGFTVLQGVSLDVGEAQLRDAVTNAQSIAISPWGEKHAGKAVSFVFDLIAVPDKSELANLLTARAAK